MTGRVLPSQGPEPERATAHRATLTPQEARWAELQGRRPELEDRLGRTEAGRRFIDRVRSL